MKENPFCGFAKKHPRISVVTLASLGIAGGALFAYDRNNNDPDNSKTSIVTAIPPETKPTITPIIHEQVDETTFVGEPKISPDGRYSLYLSQPDSEKSPTLFISEDHGETFIRLAENISDADWSPFTENGRPLFVVSKRVDDNPNTFGHKLQLLSYANGSSIVHDEKDSRVSTFKIDLKGLNNLNELNLTHWDQDPKGHATVTTYYIFGWTDQKTGEVRIAGGEDVTLTGPIIKP